MPPVTPTSTGSINGTGVAAPAAPAPPPQPPQVESAPLPTSVDAQMQPGQNLPVNTMPKESWGRSVYHGVLSALGGANDVSLARDPKTGQMIATSVKSGPGQQWKRIISGALTGYAAAAATGAHGPGSTSAKIGAGFQAAQGRVQQQQDRMRQEANEDFETQQKAAMSNAQTALITHQLTAGVFDLAQKKVQATVADSQRENAFSQIISEGGAGSKDLGVMHNMDEVMQTFKNDPALHDHLANGRVVAIPHIGADGTIDGVHAALVTLDWAHQKNTQEIPLTWFSTEAGKDGKPELKENTFTIPKEGSTNGDIWKVLGQQSTTAVAQHAADVKERETQQKEADTKAYRTAQLGQGQQRINIQQQRANIEQQKADKVNQAVTGGNVDMIGQGRATPQMLRYALKTPELMDAVNAKYPGFDGNKIESYLHQYVNFTSGKASERLNNGGTALRHMQELALLDTNDSRIPGSVANGKFNTKATQVADELAQFYGTSTIPGIGDIKSALAPKLFWQRKGNLHTAAGSMIDKMSEFVQQWHNAAPSDVYEANMPGISDEAKKAWAYFDPASAKQYEVALGSRPPTQGGAGQAQTFTETDSTGAVHTYNIPADQVGEFKKDHPNAR